MRPIAPLPCTGPRLLVVRQLVARGDRDLHGIARLLGVCARVVRREAAAHHCERLALDAA